MDAASQASADRQSALMDCADRRGASSAVVASPASACASYRASCDAIRWSRGDPNRYDGAANGSCNCALSRLMMRCCDHSLSITNPSLSPCS